MAGTGWKPLLGSQSLKGIATPRRSSPYTHAKPLQPPGPSYTSLAAGICSWGCQADLHAMELAPYLLLAGKGGDRTGACNTCLREGFHKPSMHLPHLHRFYNNSDQTREIPIYKHKALQLERDRSAYICMYLYIQLLKDAAENPLQGARTRQERAPAPPGSR